jgi:hypothetical protein
MKRSNRERKCVIARKLSRQFAVSMLALLLLGAASSLEADPIVVRINDLAYPHPPEVEVENAPQGWSFCPCADLGVINPANEDGGLITLFGVDRNGSINEPDESGWRLLDPSLPAGTCMSAIDIVWIQHDFSGPFFNGDLQVAFNSAHPGHYYQNPDVCPQFGDASLGPVTYKWQTVYKSPTLIVQFKGHR